jgi:hypothetical protein
MVNQFSSDESPKLFKKSRGERKRKLKDRTNNDIRKNENTEILKSHSCDSRNKINYE